MEGKLHDSGMLAFSGLLEDNISDDSPSRQLKIIYVFMVTQRISHVSIYKHHLEELH